MYNYIADDPDYTSSSAESSIVHFNYDRYGSHPVGPIEWAWENYSCNFTAQGEIIDCTSPAELWTGGHCRAEHDVEVYRAIRQVMCRWYPVGSAYCPSFYSFGRLGEWLMDWGDGARRGVTPMMVRSALWDLYDNGFGGDDGTCEFHWWNRIRQSCDTWYAYQDAKAWGLILASVAAYPISEFPFLEYPRDYFQFIYRFYDVGDREAQARGEQFDECEVKNYLRTTSRFNGITLRGIFDDPDEWGPCDQWENTPGGAPPPPCAATEAVVTAVEGGVEGVVITPEEGESLLEKVRRIRDEYLLNSDRGQLYAYLYAEHSDEIIAGILGNPQTTLIALELIEQAAYKVDNLENYLVRCSRAGLPLLAGKVREQFLPRNGFECIPRALGP